MSRFFDEDVRVETLIYIPGQVIPEALPDVFEEFCDYLPERADAPIYAQLPLLARFRDGDCGPEQEELAEALAYARTKGFLVQAATPVLTPYGNPDSGIYSGDWGHYHTEWLYAPDEASIESVCCDWAAKRTAEDKAKAA